MGGITETIIDGVTGYLVPPGDHARLAKTVGDLLDDEGMRARMSEAARCVARERFTWPALAGEVAGVYRDLLG